ncbi:TIGR01906 family membrane protein [Carnobacteriaceae bacterium zg-84]|uniref:TIGR01906 family membrane protein n=1 Tax=Granulicatella sp. zg-84 TaxID=2678503 RepID=UPI0013BF7641|nr:TIGR01906 family membrane protein [Granulicatella sp. zg-84]NEW65678.1 TIGR01906 family membrane protein [Granulicatella sp. zg-84]QMI85681.1 TIGR01906 family membrane protein [Carnobacteriaceae bacterium zg-84]
MNVKRMAMLTCLTVCILSGAILITLLCKPLFLWQLSNLDTQVLVGLTHEQVSQNYDVLLGYLLNPFQSVLAMPNIPVSAQGAFHFFEVKQLFLLNNGIFVLSLVGSILVLFRIKKYQDEAWFKGVYRIMIFLPIVIVIVLSMGFNYWFVLFHHVFFNNDAWLFNPVTDPIILILTEDFFLGCFIMVFGIVEISFIVLWWYFRGSSSNCVGGEK